MIICENLSKNFGTKQAVRNLNIHIAKGQIFGFLGPNGAGKSTTILMLMGLLRPSAGRAIVGGFDPQSAAIEVRRRVGYLPDAPYFIDYLRGRELLMFVAEMHGLPRALALSRTDEVLSQLNLRSLAHEFASQYSTGMKKRLGLACALIHAPPVLILDEPTNGLDPGSARDTLIHIRRLANQGVTVLFSTHQMALAESFCDRVAIIQDGELKAQGTPATLRLNLAVGASLEDVFLNLTQKVGG